MSDASLGVSIHKRTELPRDNFLQSQKGSMERLRATGADGAGTFKASYRARKKDHIAHGCNPKMSGDAKDRVLDSFYL
jgi:hypothetical protein